MIIYQLANAPISEDMKMYLGKRFEKGATRISVLDILEDNNLDGRVIYEEAERLYTEQGMTYFYP